MVLIHEEILVGTREGEKLILKVYYKDECPLEFIIESQLEQTQQKEIVNDISKFGEILQLRLFLLDNPNIELKGIGKRINDIVIKWLGENKKELLSKQNTPEQAKEEENDPVKELTKKELKQQKSETIETSRVIDRENKIIVEQVYDEKNGSRFAIYDCNKKEHTFASEYVSEGKKYLPNSGEELEKKAVLLPTQPEEYESDEKLDADILNFLYKWVDVPDDFRQFILWNAKRSWVYELFHTTNYLRFRGDTGTGKTRGQDASGHIHYKSIFTSGATTPAPLFRIIDKWRGTLVMDEADLKNSDESAEIIKIINQGVEQGKFIMRCDQDNAKDINFFDPYCPKILGTRRGFDDKATESRCITHITTATTRKDIPVNLNEDFYKTSISIRNKLLMWRFRNFFEINPEIDYDFGDIEPRVKQIVLGYAALFSKNKKQMESFNKYITEYQQTLIEERQSSFDGAVVGAIHKLLEQNRIDISAQDIIDIGEFAGHNGKPLQPRALSGLLKSLGINGTVVRKIAGKAKRCISLESGHLSGLFKRYGYEVTVVTVVTRTSKENNEGKITQQNDSKVGESIAQEEKKTLSDWDDTHRNVCNDRNSVTNVEDAIIDTNVCSCGRFIQENEVCQCKNSEYLQEAES